MSYSFTFLRAAMRIFKTWAQEPDDELHVHNGNIDSWFGKEPRYVGKAAYRHDGRSIQWFPA